MGFIARLCQRQAKSSGFDGDLGDEPLVAIICLDGGAPQGFPVSDQLIQNLGPTWHLADYPGLQHLAELLQVDFVDQIKECGICRPALEVHAQRMVQHLSMTPGKGLHIAGAPSVAQDPEHRHQHH